MPRIKSVQEARHTSNLALITLPAGPQRDLILAAILEERLAWEAQAEDLYALAEEAHANSDES